MLSYFFIIFSDNNDIYVFRGYFTKYIILIKILKKTSFVFENISGTVEGGKKVDTPLESLPPYESKSKKNLKNSAPFPRYRDSCKKKSH